jgi:hypothetical protein
MTSENYPVGTEYRVQTRSERPTKNSQIFSSLKEAKDFQATITQEWATIDITYRKPGAKNFKADWSLQVCTGEGR